jgi:hypothetical protein
MTKLPARSVRRPSSGSVLSLWSQDSVALALLLHKAETDIE